MIPMGVILEAKRGVKLTTLLETKSSSNFALTDEATLQLVFNASIINTSDDAISIDAAGAVTANKAGFYVFDLCLNAVKTTAQSFSDLYIKTLVDAVQVGPTFHEQFNDDEESQTIIMTPKLTLAATEVVTFEVMVIGDNVELMRQDPTAITGWDDIAEAQHLIISTLH